MWKQRKQWQTLFSWAPKSLKNVTAAMKLTVLLFWRNPMAYYTAYSKTDPLFTDKVPYSQCYGFCSIHVWMWELDYSECWVPQNWCFWTMVLQKTLQSLLDRKVIKPIIPKGNQVWIVTGRTDAEAQVPIFWPPDAKIPLIRNDTDAGKDRRQEQGW